MPRQKKPRGRPPKHPMPDPLDVDMDTLAACPRNTVSVLMRV